MLLTINQSDFAWKTSKNQFVRKTLTSLAPVSLLFPCKEGARDDRVLDGIIFLSLYFWNSIFFSQEKWIYWLIELLDLQNSTFAQKFKKTRNFDQELTFSMKNNRTLILLFRNKIFFKTKENWISRFTRVALPINPAGCPIRPFASLISIISSSRDHQAVSFDSHMIFWATWTGCDPNLSSN